MDNEKQTHDQADLSNSKIHVSDSREVVIGSGNVITKIFNALGRRQFWSIAAGLIVVIVGGYYGFQMLSGGQSAAYASLSDIQKELSVLADLNADVRARLENNPAELDNWLAKGMEALKANDYPVAIQYLEKAVEQAPLATVRQNLAYAYEQLGNADKARENLEAAKKINPNLDTSKSYAQLKGKRINLLAPESGRTFVAGSRASLEELIDGLESSIQCSLDDELIVSFKDKRMASFDRFSILITESSMYNISDFELFIGNDSPTGAFSSIGKFKTQNMLLTENRYQEFTFPKVTAKYFKFKILTAHFNYPQGREIQLWGELQ
jgi:tetratricopeptide (TPR) repeat protein